MGILRGLGPIVKVDSEIGGNSQSLEIDQAIGSVMGRLHPLHTEHSPLYLIRTLVT